MVPGTIDYAASYFKYKTSILIWGESMNKALKRLQTELQANVSLVKIDLGGRNYSYLALVLSNTEYAIIPNTEPFILPTYAPSLAIPVTIILI